METYTSTHLRWFTAESAKTHRMPHAAETTLAVQCGMSPAMTLQ